MGRWPLCRLRTSTQPKGDSLWGGRFSATWWIGHRLRLWAAPGLLLLRCRGIGHSALGNGFMWSALDAQGFPGSVVKMCKGLYSGSAVYGEFGVIERELFVVTRGIRVAH